jgi:L-lactate dehydrogenase complex protein LldF
MSGQLPMEEFERNALAALADDTLRGALRRATDTFGVRRRDAVSSLPGWDELRQRARAVKDHVLERLDRYLEQFAAKAEAAGASVHWARDAEEACQIVTRIAMDADTRTVVKSKSMTTEEIGLNRALERAGLDAIETDLGEWIIQLAGEVPSHIIVPAIHKTKSQIAALLSVKCGTSPDADPETLTAAARKILRARFAEAGLGISGVNFGVAETGTIAIVENEGNARLVTSMPRVHVAIMGIEKLVPRLGDLDVFLKLLPRSGTGQRLTSYVSLLTGPSRSLSGEGPEALHIVLLDNGRSRMLSRSVTRQSLACIRCGACLNACPVYQQVGGHAYGSVYPGPIGAVITPQLSGIGRAAKLPFASSLCGACRDVCPVRIDIPQLLLHLRQQVVERAARPGRRGERWAFSVFAWVVASRRRFEWATRLLRMGQRLVGLQGRCGPVLSRVAKPLANWRAGRELRPLARKPFRELWRTSLHEGR